MMLKALQPILEFLSRANQRGLIKINNVHHCLFLNNLFSRSWKHQLISVFQRSNRLSSPSSLPLETLKFNWLFFDPDSLCRRLCTQCAHAFQAPYILLMRVLTVFSVKQQTTLLAFLSRILPGIKPLSLSQWGGLGLKSRSCSLPQLSRPNQRRS